LLVAPLATLLLFRGLATLQLRRRHALEVENPQRLKSGFEDERLRHGAISLVTAIEPA
jgi:hypothetical protein